MSILKFVYGFCLKHGVSVHLVLRDDDAVSLFYTLTLKEVSALNCFSNMAACCLLIFSGLPCKYTIALCALHSVSCGGDAWVHFVLCHGGHGFGELDVPNIFGSIPQLVPPLVDAQ